MEMAWSWDDFENEESLGRRNEDDLPGCKATDPLQKEKQSKNQINQKKKERAKNQAVTLWHNTYAFCHLFYKVYMKRENADNWNFGMEKEQI